MIDYHEQLAASRKATGGDSAVVDVTSLASYSTDKFVLLCDEARGPGDEYPDLSSSSESKLSRQGVGSGVGSAVVAGGSDAKAADREVQQASATALDGRPETRVHKREVVVDPGSQKENLPNAI